MQTQRPNDNTPSRADTGFTLVEVLVVLTVLTILAAVLIPVVNRTRESSRTTKCLANMRQVGVAFALYTSEQQGYLPRQNDNSSYSDGSWVGQLVGYVGGDFSVFGCPVSEGPQPRTSYLYNSYAAGTNLPAGIRVKAASASNPTTSILVMDQRVNTTAPFTSAGLVTVVDNPSATWWYPHAGAKGAGMGRTVLFLDGHVELVSQNTLSWRQLQWPQ